MHLTAQETTETALDLLLSIAEEAVALDTRRQGLFVNKGMQPQAPAVFSILGNVLQSCLATPGDAQAASVLRYLWSK